MHRDIIRLRRLHPTHLKWLVRSVVLLIVLTTLATIRMWHQTGRDRDRTLALAIRRKTELLNAQFDRFFEPVLLDLRALGQMGAEGILSTGNVDLARGIVEPLINTYLYQDPNDTYRNRISGFRLANVEGQGFRLSRVADKWQISWSDTSPEQPWFRGALGVPVDTIHWTEPNDLDGSGRGELTVSLAFGPNGGSRVQVVAFDLLLEEIATLVDRTRYSDRDRLFLDQGGRVVDLRRRHQPAPAHPLADPVIHAAVGILAQAEAAERERSFSIEQQRW